MCEITKICSRCKKEKPLSKFGKDNSRKDKLSYFCIDCWNEKGRKNVKKFREKRVLQNKKWRNTSSGKEKVAESRKRSRIKRKEEDPAFFIFETERTRIKSILFQKNLQKKSKTRELLGCDLEHFKQHLESQFQEDMTWENRGGRNGWHIDHIVPGNYFDLADLEQQKICFNYRNLQPLWAEENLQKHCKLPEDYLMRIENIKNCIK